LQNSYLDKYVKERVKFDTRGFKHTSYKTLKGSNIIFFCKTKVNEVFLCCQAQPKLKPNQAEAGGLFSPNCESLFVSPIFAKLKQ
jgi:hypothetical protein